MKITEVRVNLLNDSADKLRAFCSITFNNDFVVRDLKIIEGPRGLFVAMPSRKIMDNCPRCKGKNHLRAKFCNDCGASLNPDRSTRDRRGRARLYLDIAHPINPRFRAFVQRTVLQAFEKEVKHSKQPGYVPPPTPDEEARMERRTVSYPPAEGTEEGEEPKTHGSRGRWRYAPRPDWKKKKKGDASLERERYP